MKPTYSIIIPTLNQCALLKGCLEHLANLNFPRQKFEVLVVDSGSTDNTAQCVASFQGRFAHLRFSTIDRQSLMLGRHIGAQQAEGSVLCFLDDDSYVDSGWLSGVEKGINLYHAALVGGPCLPGYIENPPGWVESLWQKAGTGRVHGYLSLLDMGDADREILPELIFGCNFTIIKKVFFELGGTNPDYEPKAGILFEGDGETGLARKARAKGYKGWYCAQAKVMHQIPAIRFDIERFKRRAYFNGVGASYHNLRQAGGLAQKAAAPGLPVRFVRSLISRGRRLAHTVFNQESVEVRRIKLVLKQESQAGYQAHQAAFQQQAELREWVLRENYLGRNGELPLQRPDAMA